MYTITFQTPSKSEKHVTIRSDEVAKVLKGIKSPEAKKHLARVEEINSKGIKYSNEDFDVLSSACRFLNIP